MRRSRLPTALLPNQPSVETLLITGAAAPAAVVLVLWQQSSQASLLSHASGPDHASLTVLATAFVAAWVLMTIATMLPTTRSMLRAFATVAAGRRDLLVLLVTAITGMLAVWTAVGASLAAIDLVLHRAAEANGLSLQPVAALGFVLVLAGGYQLSGYVSRCLRSCRSPMGFLARRWTGRGDVTLQALQVGIDYGTSCMACCAGLMLVMCFAGMANPIVLVGMALLAAVQKQTSFGPRTTRPIGIAMLAVGGALLSVQVSRSGLGGG